MNLYAIIGYPLGHSCSPKYFNEKFRQEGIEAEYVSFEIEDIKQLPDLLKRNPTLQGFNVIYSAQTKYTSLPARNQRRSSGNRGSQLCPDLKTERTALSHRL